ncbi:MAG: arylsulfatase [Gammaproteobacteria bacterium]|nr:arylsulfatase [Gammaproteobacteria bacterium]
MLLLLVVFAACGLGLSGCSKRGAEQAQATAATREAQTDSEPAKAQRPNILVIVADDLGYTDMGVYGGGDIATPNLDRLANEGVLFTNFHSAPACSPTRAMLLSGVDNHAAGLGNMFEELAPNQKGQPGYEGHLSFRVASMAELLADAGYHTYMTGKWHLGLKEETSPAARGFEKSFALLQGGGGHFDRQPIIGPNPAVYSEDGKSVEELPADFYSTRYYAERMIEYLKADAGDGRPFFAYLAFTAPHWPLQAPEDSVAKYAGRYDAGYDALHAERIARMKSLGLVATDIEPFPRQPNEKSWTDLNKEERRREARLMEIYAAMVDDLDVYTGRVIDYLKQTGRYDNTFIFFMSDNGAEGHHLDREWGVLRDWVAKCCDNSYKNMGKANSYLWYGPNWARAGTGPFRLFKGFTTEGGIRVPAFAHYPARIAGGRRSTGFASVMDVMPTVLELAGVKHPGGRYRGREVLPMQGKSMLSALDGTAASVHGEDYWMGWELFGKRAIRKGDWKLVWTPAPYGPDGWELFDLHTDPAELRDVAAGNPERVAELRALWDRYVTDDGIILPNEMSGY